MGRTGTYNRTTRETRVRVTVDLDGSGQARVTTGIGMLDHLLDQVGRHGIFDLEVEAAGDVEVDAHHTVEDVGIALGRAFLAALGDGRGIVRMADALVPLDEALVQVAVDLSGRGYAVVRMPWTSDRIGELPCDLVEHFLQAFAAEGRLNLNVRVLAGVNDHHKAEATFKALARALCLASRLEPRRAGQTPSTKDALG